MHMNNDKIDCIEDITKWSKLGDIKNGHRTLKCHNITDSNENLSDAATISMIQIQHLYIMHPL